MDRIGEENITGMAERLWNVLLIEDDEDDFILTREVLSEAQGERFLLEWAPTYEAGRQALQNKNFDAILMDYDLGPQTGLELTREAARIGCKAPIILLTGRGNYEVDMEAMKAGATDYLAKNEVTPRLLERTIRYAIIRKQSEDALRAARDELEMRVQERTHELIRKNNALMNEVQERRRVEGELAEVQRRLMDRTEAERVELARDLHDGPMQDLYGVIFSIDFLIEENSQGKDEIKEKMLQVVQALRAISRDLRPPALGPYGLQKALLSHIENIRQNHPELEVHSRLMPDEKLLPERVSLSLYRTYQIAITNVLRHAKASQVTVRFLINTEEVRLEVQDNGQGFRVPRRWVELARKGHLGLVGAVERIEAIGGKLTVESAPGQGTLIRVVIPRTIIDALKAQEELENQSDASKGDEGAQQYG